MKIKFSTQMERRLTFLKGQSEERAARYKAARKANGTEWPEEKAESEGDLLLRLFQNV